MKKFIAALIVINIFSLTCYSAQHYTSEQLINKIEKASISLKAVRMERYWKTLCEQDKTTCSEKKDWFDKILYDTKVRQHDVSLMRGGFYVRY